MVKKITNANLNDYAKKIASHPKYGGENKLIEAALKNNPQNTDISVVAMKICLIDLTNGTNLSRNLGTNGGLYLLSEKITQSDFDKRVKKGDLLLVEELSKWTKEDIGKNLFSFISKYCLYHNVHCYDRDDYVIVDRVLCENLGQYITEEDYQEITGKTLRKNSFQKMRENIDYLTYIKVIDHIIQENNISVDKPHRKFDWFIWFKYGKENL